MLTIYRRHLKKCEHRKEGRQYSRCRCPIWVEGIFEGIDVPRQSLGVRTLEDAEREVEKLKQRFRAPSSTTDDPIKLSDAWDGFAADAKSRNLREATLNKYRYLRTDMERFAAAAGFRFVAEFDLAALRRWREAWPNRNVSAQKKLELVRCFFRFAHDARWIPENPASKLKAPKVTPLPTLPYEREQYVRILAALDIQSGAQNQRKLRALVLLLRHSGLRISDAVTLSRERINEGKLFLYTSKANTAVYCPLPPFVVTALEAAIEPGQRFYFWSGNGKPKTAINKWQRKLKDLCTLAKVENGHAHRFRDTFAVELLLAGVPLERVSILLGHSSVRITEKHYAPWVRSRQEQLEADVRRTWANTVSASEGTSEVHGASARPN